MHQVLIAKLTIAESNRKIMDENTRFIQKLVSVKPKAVNNREEAIKSVSKLQELQKTNLVYRKKQEYDALNEDNMKLHDRIFNQ